MGRSILILVLVVTAFAQINASSTENEHHHGGHTSADKRPATRHHHREHRPKSHGTDTAEKTKPCELEAAKGGHWEWIPDIPQTSPYTIQPPMVTPTPALSTMPPMYSFFPMPIWPPSNIPTYLPTPVQLPLTIQPHDQAPGNLLQNHTTSERKVHKRSHGNSKNHEPQNPKHTQSTTTQHKRSEVVIGNEPHDRNMNVDRKMNAKHPHTTTQHHRTSEGKIKEKNTSDHRVDHPSVDSKRTHSTIMDHNKAMEDKIDQNPAGSIRNDETGVNREQRVHSEIASSGTTGNENGNIGVVPNSRTRNAKTAPENVEKHDQKLPSTPRKFSGTQTTRV